MFDLPDFMTRLTFEPDTHVRVQPNFRSETGLALAFSTRTYNAWHREEPKGSRNTIVNIPAWALESEEAFMAMIEWTQLQTAVHESLEWVRVDNKPWINPHVNGTVSDAAVPESRAQAEDEVKLVIDTLRELVPAQAARVL